MPGNIQIILVATDFSAASEAATTHAFRLARALRAKLYLVHVVPESDVAIVHAIGGHLQSEITPEALTKVLYADAEKRLAELIDKAKAGDVVQERLIATGQPASEIVGWATAKQVQLIIVGTHGRSGLDRALLGSVAAHVLRLAACPVLVVPGSKADAVGA